ncbi:MAG: acyloxyacyl hydrolase [Chitinophagaceae bacterium]|nr:acyloxyacyl hydrolase [Chitinophagaceae bacterium]MCB9045055.1 acyloxyacyl hydrolase [Chitinophagales bacterium]
MSGKTTLLTVYLLLLSLAQLYAQNSWDGIGLETNVMRGKIFRHTKKFPVQLPKSVNGFELNALFQTYGTKDWQQRRGFPLVGFGMMYTDYGIDSIYGKCISIYPNLEIPIVKYKKFQWTFKVSFGLGYVTKDYQRYPTFDTINTAIGSHFNNFSLFATDLRYRVNQHLDVQVGGNFTHTSNAAFRTPNLGINSYGTHIGIRYFPTTSQPEKQVKELTPLKNRWLMQARLGLAARENFSADGPMYPIYIVSAFVSKRYRSKNKVFAGLDYSYHTNMYAFLRNNEILPGKEKANSWKSAVIVGNEFLLGRVGIMMQLGFYIKNYAIPEDFFYQKLGGNLYLIQREEGFLKELSASILLKAHKADAELVEVGLGVGL